MKKTITTLALALTLCSAIGQTASRPTPDAKLLSTVVDGDYEIKKWLVLETNSDKSNEFSVKYQINLARLISSYDNNAKELEGLRSFVDGITNDENKEIQRVVITGYASPDGPAELNEKLAKERAVDCGKYLKENHDIANCPCKAEGVALRWSDAKEAISKSSIPAKSEVLAAINDGGTEMEIEAKLREMTPSWDYIKDKILPSMRCVEIEVTYSSWIEMSTRTPLETEIVEDVVVENNYFVFIDENPSDVVIFENPNAPLDFNDDKLKFRFKDDRHRDKFKELERGAYGRDKAKDKMKKGAHHVKHGHMKRR